MSAPDRIRCAAPVTSLPAPEALDETSALFVLTLADDGRAVPARLLAAAEAFAERHPRVAQARADLRLLGEVLASEAPRPAPADFTERVLQAGQWRERPPASVLPLVGRLAAAAAVLLVVGITWQLGDPQAAVADPRVQRQRHVVDDLWPDPFAPPRIEQGLARLLPAPGVTGTARGAEPSPSASGEGGSR